jgi:hypothetical protein
VPSAKEFLLNLHRCDANVFPSPARFVMASAIGGFDYHIQNQMARPFKRIASSRPALAFTAAPPGAAQIPSPKWVRRQSVFLWKTFPLGAENFASDDSHDPAHRMPASRETRRLDR